MNFDQIVKCLTEGKYKTLNPVVLGSPELNLVKAKIGAVDFLIYFYSWVHKLPRSKDTTVPIPDLDLKSVQNEFKNITLPEFLNLIQRIKIEKKIPILVGNTETRKARQKQTAEVFTPDCLVSEMLGQLPGEVWERNAEFCDPAAGNGQFLIHVFIRKITAGYTPLEALKTIYGVEIMSDNVKECHERLLKLVVVWEPVTKEHIKTVLSNIVCADSLKYDFNFDIIPTEEEINNFLVR